MTNPKKNYRLKITSPSKSQIIEFPTETDLNEYLDALQQKIPTIEHKRQIVKCEVLDSPLSATTMDQLNAINSNGTDSINNVEDPSQEI